MFPFTMVIHRQQSFHVETVVLVVNTKEEYKKEEEIIQSTIKAGKMAIEADAVYMVLEIKFDMQGMCIG